MQAVRISDLSFAYTDNSPVLERVSLDLRHGEFLALIGPNGGGKTTLLRLILGLEQPTAGEIAVFGLHPGLSSTRVGYVPQFSTMQLDFPASVLEMTLMGAAHSSKRGGNWPTHRAAREKALAYLDILGLGGCAARPINALSGGQRQRALVARALMGSPAALDGAFIGHSPPPFLLLLDEPTASIDPEGKFCFYEFLGKLRGHISIVVVSHDLFMVSPFFDRIAFVEKSLTQLQGNQLTPQNLTILFGRHMHECPAGDLLHAGGLLHHDGCTHPACRTSSRTPTQEACPGCSGPDCSGPHCSTPDAQPS